MRLKFDQHQTKERLGGGAENDELRRAVNAKLVPFAEKEHRPLQIGSGDRCERVKGSCYRKDDPVVAAWISSQKEHGLEKQIALIYLFAGAAFIFVCSHLYKRGIFRDSRLYFSSSVVRFPVYFAVLLLISCSVNKIYSLVFIVSTIRYQHIRCFSR
jgi:hypothetical protein